LLPAIEAL